MNDSVLYALAEVAAAIAAFSGLVVVFRSRGARRWSPTELRYLWLLLADSFIVMLLALLPVPLFMATWSADFVWAICSSLLAAWFFVALVIALRGERADARAGRAVRVPYVTPILYLATAAASLLGVALVLSALNVILAPSEALFVFGLIALLGFAAVEFLFFIGLMSLQEAPPADRDRVSAAEAPDAEAGP